MGVPGDFTRASLTLREAQTTPAFTGAPEGAPEGAPGAPLAGNFGFGGPCDGRRLSPGCLAGEAGLAGTCFEGAAAAAAAAAGCWGTRDALGGRLGAPADGGGGPLACETATVPGGPAGGFVRAPGVGARGPAGASARGHGWGPWGFLGGSAGLPGDPFGRAGAPGVPSGASGSFRVASRGPTGGGPPCGASWGASS